MSTRSSSRSRIFLTVKLTGSVSIFWESAEASNVVSRLSGVTLVDNEIAARKRAERSSTTS